MYPFFTVGHSNQSLEDFFGLLRESCVELLVDVRTVPRSRTNPQFNMETLPVSLKAFGIEYEHSADLGGLRGKSRDLDSSRNGFWTNESFHNYADYALSEQFHAALDRLVEVGRLKRTVVMCAEAVWWRCHRRIISDYLLARGEAVKHIMRPGHVDTAILTTGAKILSRDKIEYPVPLNDCCTQV